MSSIEDVIMNGNNTKAPKKGHPFLLIFMFLIIIALCLLIYFKFFYITDEVVDYTEDFFEYLSTNNVKIFANDNLYSEILNKIETKDYEAESSISLSTTMDIEELNDIDISKLITRVNSISKKENNENFFDIDLKYLDNEIINGKVIEKEKDIYVTSDEIVNMYVGGEKKEFYPILANILNKEIDFYKIEKVKEIIKNRIEYTELDLPIYAKIIKESIEPGKIQKKDNVIIQDEDSSITTVEYKIELSQEETNDILIKILENIKKDEELLQKFVNSDIVTEVDNQANLNVVGENTVTANEQIAESSDEQHSSNVIENNIQVIQNDNLNNSINESSSPISNIKLENSNEIVENELEKDSEQTLNIEEAKSIIKSAITREKKNITLTDLQNAIQTIINEVSNLEGNGVTLSIYVENNKIVKLSMILIDNSNLDIEFEEISEKENKVTITYLKDLENNTGISIELYKNKNEAATQFDILISNIENKKITKKIKIETNLKGTVLSNSISTSVLLTYTDNTGEFKTNLDSQINFGTESQIEELNETNSFNVVTAEEIYKQNIIEQLKSTIDSVYNTKKEQMRLIDNNTSSSEIGNNNSSEEKKSGNLLANTTKDDARQALVDKISQMMTEAQARNEEFGLNKLNGLEIEGHKVSAIINSNLAIITIDGYTFNIDSEFNLSDAQ